MTEKDNMIQTLRRENTRLQKELKDAEHKIEEQERKLDAAKIAIGRLYEQISGVRS